MKTPPLDVRAPGFILLQAARASCNRSRHFTPQGPCSHQSPPLLLDMNHSLTHLGLFPQARDVLLRPGLLRTLSHAGRITWACWQGRMHALGGPLLREGDPQHSPARRPCWSLIRPGSARACRGAARRAAARASRAPGTCAAAAGSARRPALAPARTSAMRWVSMRLLGLTPQEALVRRML